jgi:EAL domain-containing protein (putative c-di-GMP-specific phosphodiesterase class I)
VGAEALVRWRHSPDRLLAPAEFIDEAERSGLITSVDRLVRAEVLQDLGGLIEAADGPYFTSINLSARHLHHPDLIGEVAEDLLAAEADPGSLVIEITESALIHDVEAASQLLGEIRDLGVRLALDDFGTGYSSLSYLRHLPIQLLKIAQPFIADLTVNHDRTFVEAITNLSHTLGFEVVAEGIETEPALRAVQDLQCDLGQGFFFAKPLERRTLLELLSATRPLGVSKVGVT